MNKTLLKSKLHRINVTQVELDYEGSCAVDRDFLKLAEAGSKTLSVNGAAAHKVSIDDVVIICTYGSYDETEAKTHIPTLVYFDKSNNVTKVKNTIPEQKLKSV
jgi:aspartate 1-decarboxylase